MMSDRDYFYEVITAYGVIGYFSSLEQKVKIFDSKYMGLDHVTRQYLNDKDSPGDIIYTIYYRDMINCPAYSTNNIKYAEATYTKFEKIALVDDVMESSNRINKYKIDSMVDVVVNIVDEFYKFAQVDKQREKINTDFHTAASCANV